MEEKRPSVFQGRKKIQVFIFVSELFRSSDVVHTLKGVEAIITHLKQTLRFQGLEHETCHFHFQAECQLCLAAED